MTFRDNLFKSSDLLLQGCLLSSISVKAMCQLALVFVKGFVVLKKLLGLRSEVICE